MISLTREAKKVVFNYPQSHLQYLVFFSFLIYLFFFFNSFGVFIPPFTSLLCTAFEYKNDSVLVVDKWDYYHCNTSKPITAFNNGMSVIKLDRSGPFYFISGNIDHCKNGQRLLVEVMSVHPVSASPPSIAFAPMSDMGMAPAPSPSSGVQVSVTLSSVFLALIATSVGFLWFET